MLSLRKNARGFTGVGRAGENAGWAERWGDGVAQTLEDVRDGARVRVEVPGAEKVRTLVGVLLSRAADTLQIRLDYSHELVSVAVTQPQGLTPAALIERNHPDRIRVTRRDSSHVDLRTPVIQGDSIQGLTSKGEAAVALSDIAYLSLNRGNRAGVAALAGVGVAAGVIVLLAATGD